jgi:uncharacterized protein (TIGR00252 family)
MLQQLKRDTPLHFPRSPKSATAVPNRQEIAAVGEQLALDWFLERGHVLLERNWRSGRFSEIDLILRRRDDGLIIFLEVKTRRMWRQKAGFIDHGFDAINWNKRRKILIGAQSYLSRMKAGSVGCRFDAALITYENIEVCKSELLIHDARILHISGAFDSV